MSAGEDPLEVDCPRCQVGPGEACLKPSGEETSPHAARQRLADREAADALARAHSEAPDRITGPRWVRLFVACRLELEQAGAWTSLAREQLEVMVRSMAQAEAARARAELEPTVEGSQGQPVLNPRTTLAMRLDERSLSIAKALKLTPDTRGTSAAVPADAGEHEPVAGGERDELADLDDLARKRREKRRGR